MACHNHYTTAQSLKSSSWGEGWALRSDGNMSVLSIDEFRGAETSRAEVRPRALLGWRDFDFNETLLVVSHDGRDTGRACAILDQRLLGGKGRVGAMGCVCGFSYIGQRAIRPDNLSICDVGDGVAVPERLRRPDLIVAVYSGDGRDNFRLLPQVVERVKHQLLTDAKVAIFHLEVEGRTEERLRLQDQCEIQARLGADYVTEAGLIIQGGQGWVRYARKRKKPPGR
jgi:hypothetical protein